MLSFTLSSRLCCSEVPEELRCRAAASVDPHCTEVLFLISLRGQFSPTHSDSRWPLPFCHCTPRVSVQLTVVSLQDLRLRGARHDSALPQCHSSSAWSVNLHLTTLHHAAGQQGASPNAPQARAAAPGLPAFAQCSVLTSTVPCRSRGTRREPDHPSGHSSRDLQRGSQHYDGRSRDVGRRDDRRPGRRDKRIYDDRSRRSHDREHTGRDKRKRDDEVRSRVSSPGIQGHNRCS